MDRVAGILDQQTQGLVCEPLLPAIAAQARNADATRSLDPAVIAAIKASDLMAMSASASIGGLDSPVLAIARELEAIAAACSSTAWCLWNHHAVFHWYCEALGPDGKDLLSGIVSAHEWCAFPQGAGSAVRGLVDGADVVLNGRTTFGSGARYGEWAGCVFAMDTVQPAESDAPDLRFTIVRTDSPGLTINANWEAMSMRASATDELRFDGVRVPVERVRIFDPNFAAVQRDPATPVLAQRYHEDWVPVCVLWLAAQAVGIAGAALRDTCAAVASRRDIGGVKVATRPSVQLHIGDAAAQIAAARSIVLHGCEETDARVAAGACPSEGDQLRQYSQGTTAIRLCDEAMRLLLRVQGGTALRESADFERRYRDFQAIPLHITGHPDRTAESNGRYLLEQSTLGFLRAAEEDPR